MLCKTCSSATLEHIMEGTAWMQLIKQVIELYQACFPSPPNQTTSIVVHDMQLRKLGAHHGGARQGCEHLC